MPTIGRILLLVSLAAVLGARDLAAQRPLKPDQEKRLDKKNGARFVDDDQTRAWNRDLKVRTAVHVRTHNFFLHFDVPRVKYGQRIYKRPEAALLYSRRLEEMYRHWTSIFGEPHRRPRDGYWTVWILGNERDSNRIRATLIGGGDKLFSPTTPMYVVGDNKTTFTSDELLHANVYHHVSHLITQQGFQYGKGEPSGWFTAGVAHWLEIQKFGETRNFTTGEVASKKDRWQMGKWPKKVFSPARKEKAPKLAGFCNRSVKKLNAMLSAFSWSMVDYIICRHEKVRGDFARSLAANVSTEDALREHFGWSIARFQDEWRKYCIKNQGKSEMKPPRDRRW